MTGIWRVRAAVLMLVGALVVHQARYLLAPPEHAHVLAGVHNYLGWLMPLTAALLFIAVVQLAVWMGRASRAENPELPSMRGLWLAASACLLVVFSVQETLELTAAHAQLPELGELLGHLGWQLIPLALTAGGLLALLLKGAAHVMRRVLGRRTGKRRRLSRPARPRPTVLAAIGSVLARHLAGRAPPPLSY